MARKKRKKRTKKKNKILTKIKDFIDLKTNIPTQGKRDRKAQQQLATTEFFMDTVGEDPADKRLGRIGSSASVRRRRRSDARFPEIAETLYKRDQRDKKEKQLTPPMETTEGKYVEPSLLRKLQLKGSAINRKAKASIGKKKGGKISEGTKFVARQYGGKIGK